MPDCFTSPEYELPCSEGFYEIVDFFGKQAVPDAQDIEEFRRREEERRKWMQKALTV